MLIYAARESILEQICNENGNAIFYVKIIKKDSFKRMFIFKKSCFATKALLIFLAFILILVCQD